MSYQDLNASLRLSQALFGLTVFILIHSHSPAQASQQPQKCNQAYQSAKSKCEAATQAGNARAAQGLPTSSNQNIAINSGQHANMDAAQCAGNGLAGQGCAIAYSQCMQGCSDYDPSRCSEFQTKGSQGLAQAQQSCANQGQSKDAENASMPPIQPPKGDGEDQGQSPDPSQVKPKKVVGTPSCEQQTDGVSNPDCNDTFVKKCWSDPANSTCKSFANSYCSGNKSESSTLTVSSNASQGAGSSFCTYSLSVSYCQDPSHRLSPACQWIASRPLSCDHSPESNECLAKHSEEMQTSCQDQGSDPLCAAHASGHLALTSSLNAEGLENVNSGPQEKDTLPTPAPGDPRALSTQKIQSGFISVASVSSHASRPTLWNSARQLIHESCDDGELEACGLQEDMPEYVNETSKGFK